MATNHRRTVLTALAGVGLTATGLAGATDDDCENTECGPDTGGPCPPENGIEIRTEYGAEDATVHYHIRVDGYLELPNGERVSGYRDSLDGHRSRVRRCKFPYAGELKCLSVRGPGHATINQSTPCNDS